jgi:hypothetical protein
MEITPGARDVVMTTRAEKQDFRTSEVQKSVFRPCMIMSQLTFHLDSSHI